jgi:hypothetical protein
VTKERLEWIMSGINHSKLNKLEKGFIKKQRQNFEKDGVLTVAGENRLEMIYRFRSR